MWKTTHTVRVRLLHPGTFDREVMRCARYEFRIRGQLGERRLSSFGGFDAEVIPPETVLRGSIEDQAALHGVLQQIEALGLELLEVRQVGGTQPEAVGQDTE